MSLILSFMTSKLVKMMLTITNNVGRYIIYSSKTRNPCDNQPCSAKTHQIQICSWALLREKISVQIPSQTERAVESTSYFSNNVNKQLWSLYISNHNMKKQKERNNNKTSSLTHFLIN